MTRIIRSVLALSALCAVTGILGCKSTSGSRKAEERVAAYEVILTGAYDGQAEAVETLSMTVSQGPIVLMPPLEVELEKISRDLDRATDFLLASLP